MPWIARKAMRLGDHDATRGSVLTEKVIATIPELRWNTLVRVGYVDEVEDVQLGEFCKLCDQGPFTRLARHMTAVHDDTLIAEATEVAEVEVKEEAVGEEE